MHFFLEKNDLDLNPHPSRQGKNRKKKHLDTLGFEPWAFRFESQNTNHWAMKTQTKNKLISIELMNQLKMKVEIWLEF